MADPYEALGTVVSQPAASDPYAAMGEVITPSRHFKVSTASGKALEFDAPQDATDEQIGGIARDQLKAKFGGDFAPAVRSAPEDPSVLDSLKRGTEMTLAGAAKGVGYLADAGANALAGAAGASIYYGGNALAAGADMFDERNLSDLVSGRQTLGDRIRQGASDYSEPFRHPFTIAGGVDAITGGPQSTADKVNEFGGQMIGGVQAVGQKTLTNALAPAVPKAINALAQTQGQKVAAAANRQGVEVLPADVGGTAVRKATAGIVQTPLGAGPIVSRAKQAVETFKAAKDRIANAIASRPGSSVRDNVGAGEVAQKGAHTFIDNTEGVGGKLYDSIPIHPEAGARLDKTRATLDEINSGLKSNPELSKLWAENPRLQATLDALTPKNIAADGQAELAQANKVATEARGELQAAQQGYRDARASTGGSTEAAMGRIEAARAKVRAADAQVSAAQAKSVSPPEGGELSWEDLKRFRSIVGKITGRPSLNDDGPTIDAMRKLYGALSEDMRATAQSQGPKALTAFNRANSYWAARQGRIDNVMSAILGKDMAKNPEGAFAAIRRWGDVSNGDIGKLTTLFRSLPKDEADTVRATLLTSLGKAKNGVQNAEGDKFSPAEFLSNWNQISPRAKAIFFHGDHRAALDDLATVAGSMKEATTLANHSNTGNANAVGSMINTVATGGVIFGGPKTVAISALTLAGQHVAGRILSSPALVRQLTKISAAPSKNAAVAMVKGMTAIASREPAIKSDVAVLQQHLMNAINDNAPSIGSLAASPDQGPQQK